MSFIDPFQGSPVNTPKTLFLTPNWGPLGPDHGGLGVAHVVAGGLSDLTLHDAPQIKKIGVRVRAMGTILEF